MNVWQDTYLTHLRSPYWRELRRTALAEANGRCGRCDAVAIDLQLHHKHYRTLGAETHEDVVLLCPPCHEIADVERAKEGVRRANQALYNARRDGWARRRFGPNWADDPAIYEELSERFDEWLQDHDD